MASVFRNENLHTVIEVHNAKEFHTRSVVDGTIGDDTIIATPL